MGLASEVLRRDNFCDGLYMFGPGSGTIWRCSLIGVGVALLEWVWPCWNKCGLVGVGVSLRAWALRLSP